MIVTHVKPENWVDTEEPEKVQPSDVAGIAHEVVLDAGDIALLTGPMGPTGPKGDKGDAGNAGAAGAQGPQGASGSVAVAALAVGAYCLLIPNYAVTPGALITADGTGSLGYATSAAATTYAGVVPAGQKWRCMLGWTSVANRAVLFQRVE